MDPKAKAEAGMKERIGKLRQELMTVRTGRANPLMLEAVKVEYYGQLVPLKQVAAVAVPEARIIELRPWDPAALEALEKAIQKADLGVQPQNDSKVLRLIFPTMTEERRKDVVKAVGKLGEEFRVAVRNLRRDALEELKKTAKDQKMPEDRQKAAEGEIQKLTDSFVGQIDQIIAEKQKEVTTV
ncbi:MAG TPA: ribosome recycling factor [Elusimicrobiota bacterium]|jgi:ribosome recycling factor|nr:ribosome recycling factor [Elusimicrobiota bacterium]